MNRRFARAFAADILQPRLPTLTASRSIGDCDNSPRTAARARALRPVVPRRPVFAMSGVRLLLAVLVSALPLVAGACAPPVGAVRVDPRTVQRELTGNVLTSGELSRSSRNVLFLHGLLHKYEDTPEAALSQLHDDILTGHSDSDLMAAASELSFLYAEQSGNRAYYFAAAVYAWIFLFPEEDGKPPDPFDPRLRMAADLYNRGITLGLSSPDGEIDLRSETFDLPWGRLDVAFDDKQLIIWSGHRLTDFIPVAELRVDGLEARFRRPGLGAALAAGLAPVTEDQTVRDFVAPRIKVPVTALLRFDHVRRQLADGTMQSTLDLYTDPNQATVTIAGQRVPLELEPTAALAWGLQEAPPWQREFQGFFGSVFQVGKAPQLISASPHKYGRNRVQRGSLGGDDERALGRSGDSRALRVLVLLVRHRQPDPLLLYAIAGRAHQRRQGPRPRRQGPRAQADGRNRPQPGGASDEDDGSDHGQQALRRGDEEASRRAQGLRRDALADPPLDVRRAPALREAGDLHLHAPPGQLPGEAVRRQPGAPARQHAGSPREGHRRGHAES